MALNTYRPPPPPPNITPLSQAKKKKPPVPWDKDGADGLPSIHILLDWLTIDGNYQRWRGDTKGGLTKAALANEILAIMIASGINHRDNKGIQTKIQELQNSYSKASDFLRNTGSGLQEEDIANGTRTLPMALTKICKYWDELHPIMGSRTVATPLHTAESTALGTPNLTGGRITEDDTNDHPDLPSRTSDLADTPTGDEDIDPTAAAQTSSPGPASRSGGKKRKSSKKDVDPLGLGQLMTEANSFRRQCFAARKTRDTEKRAMEKKRVKLEAARDKTAAALERRRIRVMEIEAQMKIKKFESEEIRNRISYMKELKELGHSKKEIERFFESQYSLIDQGKKKGSQSGLHDRDEDTSSDSDSSSESCEDDGNESSEGSAGK